MSTDENKICKMCYKEISPKAKKCPYCQHWQNKWSMITFHPLFAILPAIILIACMGTMFETTFDEGEPFAPYADSVSVVNAEMVFGISECDHNSPTVAILGSIRNESDIAWEDIKLEARFFNKDDKLVDAIQREKYSFMAPANDESTFKLSFKREFPQKDYSSFKIRVISAKDEKKRF